jgi:eukaryotic-like serine/threonine-protein kinase
MAESHLEFTKPSQVVGRYALYGRLAAGGMATVHLGRVMEADGTTRTVAVKRLHPQFCKDPEFVAMFIDEARLAARIKHPNVVETLDILTMGQELLLVMEYIRGECFSKLLRAARRKNLEPSIGVVGRIASGMLHGLHAAHEATDDRGEALNVVHRDISPQNVMIDANGLVKVLDFGVAKASARIQITRDGQMKGKLSYMSPEQLQGMPVDRRADVFACGVVLWEALTRRRLFVGEDASEVLRKILRDEVPPPSQWVAGLSPEVDAVVLRALSKDPEQRYQTAEELALDVEKIIELASEAEVGLWIDSVAGEILGKRERLLEEIERVGSGEFSFLADGASSPTHGSITESDTFQRIQSWAEREAARAAADGQASFVPMLDDSDAEPAQTVADARCVDAAAEAERSGPVASTSPALKRSVLGGADADEPDSAVTLAEEPSFAVAAAPPAPIVVQGVLGMAAQPARRNRRWVTILAAAAIVTGMASIAVLSVQPSSVVVSTSGALLPESESSESETAAREEPARATGSTNLRVAAEEPQDLPIGRAVATVSQVVTEGGPAPVLEAPQQRTLSPMPPATPPSAAVLGQTAADEAAAAERVNLALTQLPKERVQSPLRKTPKRAVPPRRGKQPAPAPKAAASKVDCRQPFWIDEGGIRRLKMACL